MKTKILLSVVLVPTLLLAACAPKAAATSTKGTSATTIAPVAKATTVPREKAKATPTAHPSTAPTHAPAATSTPSTSSKPFTLPTPAAALINDLSVDNQSIQSGHVLINLVDAMKPGWVAIFTDENGQPGALLGYTAVPEGTSEDVEVTIDTNKAADKMIAMLLVDAGKIGTFEYPGADEPVRNANINQNVMAIFNRLSTSQ
jgi:hypothetical protein